MMIRKKGYSLLNPIVSLLGFLFSSLVFFLSVISDILNLSFDKAERVKAEASNSKIVMTSAKAPIPKKVEEKKPTIPVVTFKKTVNYSVPKGSVALTFDDGPSKYSIKMVNILKKYQVGGHFLLYWIERKKTP